MDDIEKVKKPIYKKWWFWTIIVLLLVIIGSLNPSHDTTNTSNNTDVSNNITSSTSNSTDNFQKSNDIEITVADFSTMSREEVQKWFDDNNIKGKISDEYSSTVAKGSFINQSVVANTVVHEKDKITVTYSLGKAPTMGEKNALSSAKAYLNTMAFSYKGLIEQLNYEGFSNEEATYGADNCGADWNEQAAKSAKAYLNTMAFSRSGLIEQLEYEGFTKSQAEYGAKAVGY